MVSYLWVLKLILSRLNVLILIVVEDGLVLKCQQVKNWKRCVLILIVVEDGLVPIGNKVELKVKTPVLILIVVEDGLVLYLLTI